MYRFYNNSFYDYSFKDSYVNAGSWPDGGVDVSDDVYYEFLRGVDGKKMVTGGDGYPEWVKDNSKEEMELSVLPTKLDNLMAEATKRITPLRDAVDLGIATEDEQEKLKVLIKYRVDLMRTDISKMPVNWPDVPE